jgi:acyl-CoA thioesterase-1
VSSLRLCCVGDSITSGQGDDECLGWPGRIGRRAAAAGQGCTVYNLGVRGDTSRDIAARWKSECRARLPADARGAVVFAFGVNDATEEAGALRVPLDQSLAHARVMLAEARPAWPCLWLGPAPVDERRQPMTMENGALRTKRNAVTSAYNEAYRGLAAQLDVPYLDVLTPLLVAPAWCADDLSDGLHPTASGYERLTELVWRWPAFQSLLTPH